MTGPRYIQLTLALLAFMGARGQHTPLTSQYLFNGLLINPAYAGSRDAFTANLTWRRQWAGFKGAPETQILSLHSPIRNSRVSAGVLLVNDRIGVSRETALLTNYAYRLPIGRGTLQFGLGAGVSLLQANWTSLAVQDRNDAQFAADTRSAFRPNFSTGLFYYQKRFFVGASLPFALHHSFNVERQAWTMSSAPKDQQPMLTGGYVFRIRKDLQLKPSTLIRYQSATGIQADLSANLIFRDRIWTGLSYRSNDAITGSFEVLPTPQWRIGYAYDLSISRLLPYHFGSHEVMVQYEFGKRIRVRNSRYF